LLSKVCKYKHDEYPRRDIIWSVLSVNHYIERSIFGMAKRRGPDWAEQVIRSADELVSSTPAQFAVYTAVRKLIERYERESSRRGWQLTREIAAERLRELREILAKHRDLVSAARSDIGACVDELEEAFPDLKQ
jgi:PHP family Zn ribbon phosphoesterase